MPVWVKKAGEDAVGAPAGLAADALHASAIHPKARAGLSLVTAPADQRAENSTVEMRTAGGKRD